MLAIIENIIKEEKDKLFQRKEIKMFYNEVTLNFCCINGCSYDFVCDGDNQYIHISLGDTEDEKEGGK